MIPQDEPIVLDTNILVHYTRGNKLAGHIEQEHRLLQRVSKPIISVVSKGEILALSNKFNWGAEKKQVIIELLSNLVIANINSDAVIGRYAQISHYLSTLKPAVTIGQNDMWIAATASCLDAHVISTDKDFKCLSPTWIKFDWIDETRA
ncbi:MAG: type II toxin-antitoxin system VapC family toxin [Candidatus Melainabacteria bacterium]|nr:type II toxin-antitoxin system VapC family toxin [Candidatus Melainabacteria bacterium]